MALKSNLKTVMNNVNINDTIAGDGEKYNTGVWRKNTDEEEEKREGTTDESEGLRERR